MRSNTIQLSQNRAEVMSSARHIQAHHLLDRLDPNKSIGDCGNVVQTIPVRRDHRVHAVFGNLFHAAMQVADIAIEIDHGLAVELQHHAQNSVRGRMLRPHVERHLRGVQHRLLSRGDFYLMHTLIHSFRGRTCPAQREHKCPPLNKRIQFRGGTGPTSAGTRARSKRDSQTEPSPSFGK